jgi:twitching motility protein PilT
LETAMQSGGAIGMQTMDSALMALVKKGRIDGLDAYQQANNKDKFRRLIKDEDAEPE